MYFCCIKSKLRGCLCGFIIICVFMLFSVLRSLTDLKSANYRLLSAVRGKNFENEGRISGPKLDLDKGLSKDGPLTFGEINKEGNSGDSTKFILINSYMRSGSTYLGQELGFRSNTFYYYEPLHKLWIYKYTKGPKLCDFKKPFCEYRYEALETSLKFLSDVFYCKLQNHSEKLNQPLIRMFSGPKWNSFSKCVTQHRNVTDCLAETEKQCVPTRYRVVKVLRMSLADAALLLPRHPNLVIVHLFRDPRGIFNSHINTGWFPLKMGDIGAFVNDTKANCERITDDLIMGITLKTKFPDRVKFVQYEDIYHNAEKIKNLLKLLGMDNPHDSDRFPRSPTARRLLRTVQFNSLSGPFKYRMSLPFELVKIVDNHCKDALRMLGLKTYESEADLHDNNFNPIDGKLPFEL